jgi:hypothetical protein
MLRMPVSALAVMMMATAMMTTATASSATIKSASTTPITSTATIEASAATTVTPTATVRPLESRARIAAHARIAPGSEFLSRCAGVSRSAGFAGEKNGIVFDHGFGSAAIGGNPRHSFRFYLFQSFFVSQFRAFRFGQRGVLFNVLVFFLWIARFRVDVAFFFVNFFPVFFGEGFVFLFLFFLVFFEFRTTGEGVSFRTSLRFLVFCFHQARGKSGELFVAQSGNAIALRFVHDSFVFFVQIFFYTRFGDGSLHDFLVFFDDLFIWRSFCSGFVIS